MDIKSILFLAFFIVMVVYLIFGLYRVITAGKLTRVLYPAVERNKKPREYWSWVILMIIALGMSIKLIIEMLFF